MPPFNFSFWRTKERNEVWVHLMIWQTGEAVDDGEEEPFPREVSASETCIT